MGKRMGIKEASKVTGLSEWELRTGCKSGKYPHMRVGSANGKILFDIDILEDHIKKMMLESVQAEEVQEYGIIRKVK